MTAVSTVLPVPEIASSHLVDLLADDERAQLAAYGVTEVQDVRRLVKSTLEAATARRMVFVDPAGKSAVVLGELPFDSDMYGFPMAELLYVVGPSSQPLDQALAYARAHAIRHLHYRVSAQDVRRLQQAEHRGFRLMAVFLGLLADCAAGDASHRPETAMVGPARPEDEEALSRICDEAFSRGTRFHADPDLPETGTRRLHARWLANSLNGTVADAVLVARAGGEVAGFVTCRREAALSQALGCSLGSIGLLAVAPPWQGRGIGRCLTQAVQRWGATHGLERLEVGTEATNLGALRTYLACGFQIVRSACSLHLTLNREPTPQGRDAQVQ